MRILQTRGLTIPYQYLDDMATADAALEVWGALKELLHSLAPQVFDDGRLGTIAGCEALKGDDGIAQGNALGEGLLG